MVGRTRSVIGSALAAVLMGVGCGPTADVVTTPATGAPATHPNPPRTVQVVRPEPIAAASGLAAALYVENDVKLAARATGPIAKVLVDRGARVSAGQTLALIETSVPEQVLHLAEHELELAREERARLKPLEEQKVVSSQECRRAEIAENLAATKVDLARAQLERYSVRAPFRGQIVERWAVVGQHIVEDDGTPLFRIVADQPPRARLDVPEREQSAWPLRAAVIIQALDSGAEVAGRVVFKSPVVDAASGTVSVIVEVAQAGRNLSPGAAVRVRTADNQQASVPAWRIPADAVSGDGSAAWLMLVRDGAVKRQPVDMIARSGESAHVRGQLAKDDMIIVGAGPSLVDGEPVRVVQRNQ